MNSIAPVTSLAALLRLRLIARSVGFHYQQRRFLRTSFMFKFPGPYLHFRYSTQGAEWASWLLDTSEKLRTGRKTELCASKRARSRFSSQLICTSVEWLPWLWKILPWTWYDACSSAYQRAFLAHLSPSIATSSWFYLGTCSTDPRQQHPSNTSTFAGEGTASSSTRLKAKVIFVFLVCQRLYS